MPCLYQDITRLSSKAKVQMASGQGSHWLVESPKLFIYVKPALLRYVLTLFLNIFTLLAVAQSLDNVFHSFTVL